MLINSSTGIFQQETRKTDRFRQKPLLLQFRITKPRNQPRKIPFVAQFIFITLKIILPKKTPEFSKFRPRFTSIEETNL